MTYQVEAEKYEEMSGEFTELNREHNRAVHDDALTDELELKFFKAEKALAEQYAIQQAAKQAEQDEQPEGDD